MTLPFYIYNNLYVKSYYSDSCILEMNDSYAAIKHGIKVCDEEGINHHHQCAVEQYSVSAARFIII